MDLSFRLGSRSRKPGGPGKRRFGVGENGTLKLKTQISEAEY
jgi:hypothetical protein